MGVVEAQNSIPHHSLHDELRKNVLCFVHHPKESKDAAGQNAIQEGRTCLREQKTGVQEMIETLKYLVFSAAVVATLLLVTTTCCFVSWYFEKRRKEK